MALIDNLISENWLKTERIIKAFKSIQRKDFLPKGMEHLAELNEALPIGQGQTISQPLTVAFMFELLQPEPGNRILDIGAGSGWTSALLASIVGEKGKVVAIEIIPELAEFGGQNVAKYNFIEKGTVDFICGDGSLGYKKEALFDRILCSASIYPISDEILDVIRIIPAAWKDQLRVGGIIVTPIKNSIWAFKKINKTEFEEKEYPGFVFVPLIAK